ncbi:hypothetical protein CSUI_006895, partial [Cystoisospora suis]
MGTARLLSCISSIIFFVWGSSSYLLYKPFFVSLSFSHRFLLVHPFLLFSFLVSSPHLSCCLSVSAVAHGSISPWSFKGILTPPYMSPTREDFLPTFQTAIPLAVTPSPSTRHKCPRRLPYHVEEEERLSYSNTPCSNERHTTPGRWNQPNSRSWLGTETDVPLPPLGLLVSPHERFSRPPVLKKKRKQFSSRKEGVSLSSSYALDELQSSIRMSLPSRLSVFAYKSFTRHSSMPYHSQAYRPNPPRNSRQEVSYISGFLVYSTPLKRRKSPVKRREKSSPHLPLSSFSYDALVPSLNTITYPAQRSLSLSTPLSFSRSFFSPSSSIAPAVDSSMINPPIGLASFSCDNDRHRNFSSSLHLSPRRGEDEEENKKANERASTSSYQAKKKSRIQEEEGRDNDFQTPHLKTSASSLPRGPRRSSSYPSSHPYRSHSSHEKTPDGSFLPSSPPFSVPYPSDRLRDPHPSRAGTSPGLSSRHQHHRQQHPHWYERRDRRPIQREGFSQEQGSSSSYPSPSPRPFFQDSQTQIEKELPSFSPNSFSSPNRRRNSFSSSSSSLPPPQASSQAPQDYSSPQRYRPRRQQRHHIAECEGDLSGFDRDKEESVKISTRGHEERRLLSSSLDGWGREDVLPKERRRQQRSFQSPHDASLPLPSPSPSSSYEAHETKNVLRKEIASLRSTPSGTDSHRLAKKEGEQREEHEKEEERERRRIRTRKSDLDEMTDPSLQYHHYHRTSQKLQRPSFSSTREESLQLLDWMLQQRI